MCENEVWSGIIIGSIAGFVGGILVWLVSLWRDRVLFEKDKKKIYDFLNDSAVNTRFQQRSAKVIANNTGIPKDRVIHIAYTDQRLHKVITDPHDLIGIKDPNRTYGIAD